MPSLATGAMARWMLATWGSWLPGAASEGVVDEARAAQRGDRTAFSSLVRRHQRAVYGLCYRLVGTADEARDVAQEAFVRAWERLSTFDASLEFGPWVLRIAHNAAIDRLRRRQRVVLLETPDPGQAEADPSGALDLERAIAELPPKHRAAVTLVYVQGWPVREAAAILDAPEGTVLTWLHRARKALRERLDP